jgi:hypothetical protein
LDIDRAFRYSPFASSQNGSLRTPSRMGSPDDLTDSEQLNIPGLAAKFSIMPTAELLVYPNDKEEDDALHDPTTGMESDNECDVFTRRGLVNVGGLFLLTAGILMLFIGYPVLCGFPLLKALSE